MKNFVGYVVLILALLVTPSCKDDDIAKGLGKGIKILDVAKASLQDAETKQLLVPADTAQYHTFLDRTKTNLIQAKSIAENVAALDPDQRRNILTILSTVRAGLDDLDMSGIKEPGVRKKIQTGLLAFGTGIDAMKIALQE